MTEAPEWGVELKSAMEASEQAQASLNKLLTRNPSAPLLQFKTDFDELLEAVRATWERYVSTPADKLLRGDRLTREEFHVMAAAGIIQGASKQLSGLPVDDYELFDLMCYDDGAKRCYINPALEPSNGENKMQAGSAPEDLSWDGLRGEQKDFFEQYDPELALRFYRAKAEASMDAGTS